MRKAIPASNNAGMKISMAIVPLKVISTSNQTDAGTDVTATFSRLIAWPSLVNQACYTAPTSGLRKVGQSLVSCSSATS